MKKTMLLVDAFAVIHRAFHALPDFTAPDGTHVNVVYGFFSTFLKALREVKPAYVVVAFDLPGPTLRHEEFAEYKATRPEAPALLSDQVPLVKELVEAMNLPVLSAPGYEAEDLIATIITKTRGNGLDYIILTGDQDTLQLASDQTKIYFLRRGLSDVALVDADKVKELWGVTPRQFIDLKALRGDPSDNIPGIPGVGEKTAAELLQAHDSLEQVFAALPSLPEKYRRLLEGKKEQALANKMLVTIHDDAPVEITLDDFSWSDEHLRRALPQLTRYNMKSLIKRILEPSYAASDNPVAKKPAQESLL